MPLSDPQNLPDPVTLLKIIRLQAEIAKLGYDLGQVMQFVATEAQTLTNADGCAVEIAEGSDMVYRAASGMVSHDLGLRLSRDGSMSGLCVKMGVPLECLDSETDDRVDRVATRKVGLRSMIVCPLNHYDTTVGAIKVLSKQPRYFRHVDLQILTLLAESIAAAMFYSGRYGTEALFLKATHDELTGLVNRALFFDRFRSMLHGGQPMLVLNFDLDGLKGINDVMGHRAGDAALKEFAARTRKVLPSDSVFARLGGDEFGALVATRMTSGDLEMLIARIHEALAQPLSFENFEIRLACSVGSAAAPDDGDSPVSLWETADQRMYENKRQRKLAAAGG